MVKDSISKEEVIAFLNELLTLDNEAITNLFQARVKCNLALAGHPTVQVGSTSDTPGPLVGILGILNGLFGVFDEGPRKGWGPFCMHLITDGKEKNIASFSLAANTEYAQDKTSANCQHDWKAMTNNEGILYLKCRKCQMMPSL